MIEVFAGHWHAPLPDPAAPAVIDSEDSFWWVGKEVECGWDRCLAVHILQEVDLETGGVTLRSGGKYASVRCDRCKVQTVIEKPEENKESDPYGPSPYSEVILEWLGDLGTARMGSQHDTSDF